ncbi:DUF1934 domain-containing protein [Limosilactobacillus avium]|uniref:DUF1934 domain-containing protein n=1 Tax=Limosilactobacillus avium TaxID=2991831 RepID=UPI0024BBD58B|nr:DUF1934 domain-containing protein [Limosilactobacillus avium]
MTTTIRQDGQQENFTFSEDGNFVELNGKYYLRYVEHQNGQATPVQFRLDDQVHLHREGAMRTQLEFDQEKETVTRYRTEYGVIRLGVVTKRLEKDLDLDVPMGHLNVDYVLKTGDQEVGNYQLQLQFKA